MVDGPEGSEDRTGRRASGLEVWVRETDRAWLDEAGIAQVDRPEQLAGAEILSRRGRGASVLVRGPQGVLLAKTLRHGGVLGRLLGESFLGAARVRGSREIAERLRAHGVRCPAVAFTRVHHRGAGRCRMELATDYLDGARDLDQFLSESPPAPLRRSVLCRTGELLRAVHEVGVQHADLNLRNLLVDAAGEVWVIDLEGSRVRPQLGPGPRSANLARLLRSAIKRGHGVGGPTGPSTLDLRALVRAYAGTGARRVWSDVARRHRRWGWRHRLAWALGGRDATGAQASS